MKRDGKNFWATVSQGAKVRLQTERVCCGYMVGHSESLEFTVLQAGYEMMAADNDFGKDF